MRQAYLNLRQNQEKVSAAQQLAQADEAYRLARLRYSAGVTKQAGVSPLIELSDAQRTLNQAQSDYVNSLYDDYNSRSTLDKAVGRYSYTGEKPSETDGSQNEVEGSGFARFPPRNGRKGAENDRIFDIRKQ